jgi:hypothetical protein
MDTREERGNNKGDDMKRYTFTPEEQTLIMDDIRETEANYGQTMTIYQLYENDHLCILLDRQIPVDLLDQIDFDFTGRKLK